MSLSERLRPGVECAPWVIEEVKKLEAALRSEPVAVEWEVAMRNLVFAARRLEDGK